MKSVCLYRDDVTTLLRDVWLDGVEAALVYPLPTDEPPSVLDLREYASACEMYEVRAALSAMSSMTACLMAECLFDELMSAIEGVCFEGAGECAGVEDIVERERAAITVPLLQACVPLLVGSVSVYKSVEGAPAVKVSEAHDGGMVAGADITRRVLLDSFLKWRVGTRFESVPSDEVCTLREAAEEFGAAHLVGVCAPIVALCEQYGIDLLPWACM